MKQNNDWAFPRGVWEGILVACIGFWFVATLMAWAVDDTCTTQVEKACHATTLVDVLRYEAHWLRSLAGRIW